MLNHEELISLWENDSKIERTNLTENLFSHPMLHCKYLGHLQIYKNSLRKVLAKYQTTKAMRQKYFNGEMTKDELEENGLQQFLFKRPLKAELESLLDASPDLQKLQEQATYFEMMISSCESIIKEINSRVFLYRSIIDYVKFESGVN